MSQQSADAGPMASTPPAPPPGDLRRLLVLAFVLPAAHYILLGALPVSLGVFYSVAYGWLGANTPTDQRGKWFGIVGALTGLALVSMPFAGLALHFSQGIDTAYLVFGLLAALSLPLALGGRPLSTADGNVISLPLLAIAGATLILSTACTGALEAFMPLLAADFSAARVAGLYVAFGAALVVGRVIGGLFGDRVGHGLLASVSMAGVATAMAAVLISLVGDVGTGSGAALAGAISGGARNGIVLFVVVTSLGAATTALRLGRPSGHRRLEVGVNQ